MDERLLSYIKSRYATLWEQLPDAGNERELTVKEAYNTGMFIEIERLVDFMVNELGIKQEDLIDE